MARSGPSSSGCNKPVPTWFWASIPSLSIRARHPADAAALDLVLIQAIRTAPLARMFYLEASLVLNAAAVGIDPIARLAEVGAEVDAWTIDPGRPGLDQTLRTLIRLGCQQITTNDPERLATRLTQLLADEPDP